jgi:hypothetical protein
MNTARTTVYEKPDFGERSTAQINSTSSLHYNHIWPQVALMVDYLVADASYRSKGAISFPSHFAEGYAYLQGRIYGDRPGKWYGEDNVWLWMPKGLLICDNPEVNYIAARGNDKLYFALMNQSANRITANCVVSGTGILPVGKGGTLGQDAQATRFTVEIPPRGISTHALKDVQVTPKFQLAAAATPWKQDFTKLEFGGTHAMVLSLGANRRWAYVYLQAHDTLKQATLRYSTGNDWREMTDTKFPFEFTVPLSSDATEFRFKIEGIRPSGEKVSSATARLAS